MKHATVAKGRYTSIFPWHNQLHEETENSLLKVIQTAIKIHEIFVLVRQSDTSLPSLKWEWGWGRKKEGKELNVFPSTKGVQCQPGLQKTQTATNVPDCDVIM